MKLLLATLLIAITTFANAQPTQTTKQPVQANVKKNSEAPKKVVLARRGQLNYLLLKGEIEDTSYIFVNDDIARNLNRLRVIDDEDEDDALPEHIRWQLFLARQLALLSIIKPT